MVDSLAKSIVGSPATTLTPGMSTTMFLPSRSSVTPSPVKIRSFTDFSRDTLFPEKS
jgi:hypothetical protein